MATQVVNTRPNNSARKTNKQRNRGNQKKPATSVYATPPPAEQTSAENPEAEKGDVTTSASTVEDEEDSDVCWICAEQVKYYSLSECNHRTCHVCALRLRALYKKMDCTFCKHPQNIVIFTNSATAQFDEFKLDEIAHKDAKLSIVFETQEMMEESLILLRFNCPDQACAFIARGWNELKVHVRAIHGKTMCDLCIRFKRVFAHEHILYPPNQLPLHLPSLPHRSSKADQSDKVEGGIHPLCEFCKECFFGDDELFSHMRERHEECFICKRQGVRDQYFLDYPYLERHFVSAHHPCPQPSCLEKKFVVFGSELDLKAHMVEEHGKQLSAKDMRDARRIEVNLEYEEPRGSGGRRRERDRDRAPDRTREREPPPVSVAAAPQQRVPDRRREGFGAALTSEDTPRSGASTPALRPNTNRTSPSPSRNVDPETIQRHAAFMARVANMTSGSSAAETSIKSAIRSYRASESTARDLITTFYNIVSDDIESTASLVNPLVDLIDDEDKKRELLQSFNGFKVEQRQQFPDLVPSGPDSAYSGVASGRVLNVKHSTTSRRSSGQVLDRVARAASSSASMVPGSAGPSSRPVERFPALVRTAPSSSSPAARATPAFRQAPRLTPWASSSSAVSTTASTSGPRSEMKSKPSNVPPPNLSSTSFPSLPAAASRTKPPVSGNQSLRNIVGNVAPTTSAWAGGGDADEVSAVAENAFEGEDGVPTQNKKSKKKGKEKVTLFTLGAFPAS